MKLSSKWKLLIFVLILANFWIFFRVNSLPISWYHDEQAYFNFFWSLNSTSGDDHTLHTGLKAVDFSKLFAAQQLDSTFRTRHFSYLCEMLTFKFSQYLGVASFRNYSLIFLHLINTFLIGLLLYRLTKSKWTAILSALLFLNSGISLSTLYFPSRIAKFVVILLFLAAWLIVRSSDEKFCNFSNTRLFLFFLTIYLALLTDEMVVFLLPLLGVDIFLKNKIIGSINKRTVIYFLTMCLTYILSIYGAYQLSHISTDATTAPTIISHTQQLTSHFKGIHFISDNIHAFFGYFLRRNFGYWDLSFWGAGAFICSVTIFIFLIRSRPSSQTFWITVTTFFLLISKAVCVPHSWGHHEIIMPASAKFPSLLFFGSYHPYIDHALLIIVIGLLLNTWIAKGRGWVLAFSSLTLIISLSNFVHANQGIEDMIQFQKRNSFLHEKAATNFYSIKKHLPLSKIGPIYLSFPSGHEEQFARNLFGNGGLINNYIRLGLHPSAYSYGSIVPVLYLRYIEKGDLIISLKNATASKSFNSEHELVNARFFFDIHNQRFVDLNIIRNLVGPQRFVPEVISSNSALKKKLENTPMQDTSSILFIKGACEITLIANERTFQTKQTFGQSYQMINFPMAKFQASGPDSLELVIQPTIRNQPVYVIGPFLSASDSQETADIPPQP